MSLLCVENNWSTSLAEPARSGLVLPIHAIGSEDVFRHHQEYTAMDSDPEYPDLKQLQKERRELELMERANRRSSGPRFGCVVRILKYGCAIAFISAVLCALVFLPESWRQAVILKNVVKVCDAEESEYLFHVDIAAQGGFYEESVFGRGLSVDAPRWLGDWGSLGGLVALGVGKVVTVSVMYPNQNELSAISQIEESDELNIEGRGEIGIEFLQRAGTWKLKRLKLRDVGLTNDELIVLLRGDRLEFVEIDGDSSIEPRALFELKRHRRLEELSVSGVRGSASDWKELLSDFPALRVVILDVDSINDEVLREMQNSPLLEWLEIRSPGISARGITYLAKMPTIRVLMLDDTALSVDDLAGLHASRSLSKVYADRALSSKSKDWNLISTGRVKVYLRQ